MNYPSGTIVQNYNVAAGRVIQLPCFMDQQEPPDGFRAIVFATPTISTDETLPPNQTGTAFVVAEPGAVQFDLTQMLQQNVLSRARSIAMSVNTNSTQGNAYLLLDSGLQIPSGWFAGSTDGLTFCDFISANPIFAMLVNARGLPVSTTWQATIAVANFKLNAACFGSGN